MDLGEQIWCVLLEESSLKHLLPYGPMLPKTRKTKWPKIQNFKFHNSLNNFGRQKIVKKKKSKI